jgi:hypothetical protein
MLKRENLIGVVVPLLSPPDEDELKELWGERATLDERQWIRLCELVCHVLRKCNPNELRGLSDHKEDYVQGFIVQKVLHTKFNGGQLESAAALCTFFTRYLRNMLKSSCNRLEYVDDESTLERMTENSETAQKVDSGCGCESMGNQIDFRRFLKAAELFWSELETQDQIYLSLHACDPEGEPLNALAARYRITSYHYRAGRLGITRKKNELPSTFSDTRIGQWMTKKLHISMTAEDMGEVSKAFQALCATALAMRNSLLIKVGYA